MISFQYIENALWLLALLPIAVLFYINLQWKKKLKRKIGDARLVAQILQGASPRRDILKISMIVLAVALLAVSLMNLQKPIEGSNAGMSGLDVMVVMDVSNSMLAKDVAPDRLEKSRLLVSKLIDTLQGNRVGIIVFAGDAYMQLPLTTDLSAARMFLQSVNTQMVTQQGTNIQAALQLANASMNPAENKYKALLLITDGEELSDKALSVAKELKQAGVVILPVGVGTVAGASVTDENGVMKLDDKGQPVVSKLNEDLLQKLAKATSGTYRFLSETNTTAAEITAELQRMDKKPIANINMVNFKSYAYWMIVLAFLLLLTEQVLPAKIKQRLTAKPALKKAAVLAGICIGCLLQLPVGAQSALLRQANEAYRQQQYNEAEKLYNQVLATDSANATARYNLGNIAYKKKQFEAANKSYSDALAKIKQKEGQAGAWNNKGLSYVEQKDLAKAVDAFKQSLRNNPYDEDVRNNYNKALKQLQQQQQQDQQQNQQNKDQQKKQQPPPKMKDDKADEKLQALRQEEKKIRDKMSKQPANNTGEKDW